MSDKNLREKLIRLAHKKPELREHVLPLLKDGIEKKAKVRIPDARTTSWNDWSDNMIRAFKECGSCVEGLVKGAATGASAYAEEDCGTDFKKSYKDLLDAEIKLKAAQRAFDKALKCMK